MKNDKTIIYIIRHGESEGNAHAHANPDTLLTDNGLGSKLTEKGKAQARTVREKLKEVEFAAIFSSDLLRARETAEILAESNKLSVFTNNTIRERNFGAKMSKTRRLAFEKELAHLADEEKLAYRYFSDGETGLEAIKRLTDFLEKIVPVYKGKTIAVINHGNVMRSFLVKEGFAKYDELPSGSVENTGYFILETDGKTYTIKEANGVYKNIKRDDEE